MSPAGRYRDVAGLCDAIDALEMPSALRARRRLIMAWSGSIVAAVLLGMALGPSPWRATTPPPELPIVEEIEATDANDAASTDSVSSAPSGLEDVDDQDASLAMAHSQAAEQASGQAAEQLPDATQSSAQDVNELDAARTTAGLSASSEQAKEDAFQAANGAIADISVVTALPEVADVGPSERAHDNAADAEAQMEVAVAAVTADPAMAGDGRHNVEADEPSSIATAATAVPEGEATKVKSVPDLPPASLTLPPIDLEPLPPLRPEPAAVSSQPYLPPTLDALPLAHDAEAASVPPLAEISLPGVAEWSEIDAQLVPQTDENLPPLPPADGWHREEVE